MDCFCQVVRTILSIWGPVSQQISYFEDLSNNMETLKSETKELEFKRTEIQAAIDHDISVGKTRIPLVEKWLTDVSNIETEVDSIRLEFAVRRMCSNSCCADHWSRYELGKRVVRKIEEVKQVKGKGDFDEVAASPPRQRVLEMQPSLPREPQRTSQQTMQEICQCLQDEENGIVGVYGMGGIGKTTLMKAINNGFAKTNDFNIVIWVTVSKDLNLGLIQEQIGNSLDIEFHMKEDKRNMLFARLKNVRYLLILDDLWEAFSLDQVGIPKPDKQNRCKIVITTRFVNVCNEMEADKQIRVRTLTCEEAWNLFYEKCGDVVLSLEIRPVAEKVVKECGGLPLAIKTVGRAMLRKDKKELWENALRALSGSSPELPGMERQVFLPLKLSYDCLENDKIRLCFLYCSLFPEDADIEIDKLIKYWVMEKGFIENVNNLEEASNKGHAILERIKDACLLEEGSKGNKYVRMHDLLRDLAIWITSPLQSSSSEGSKFLVKAGEGLVQPPEEKMGGGIVRISLMRNRIEELQITPSCPNLVSLFLNDNNQLRTIYSSFFELMPKLQILDVSDTCIKSLPVSLLLLVNLHALILRQCRHLVEVPPLGKLKELQLLDLSKSGLKNLPQGIESLVKLKWLDLSYLEDVTAIPWDMIFGLPSLEDLRMLGLKHMDGATFSKAAIMTRLSSLRITLSNLNSFIAHDMFYRWFSGLRRFDVQVAYQKNDFISVESEKQISICGRDDFPCGIEGLIKHAASLYLRKCKGLTSISQLLGDSKILMHLTVIEFSGVECVIDWREIEDDALQCLGQLYLQSLPNLKKVFDGGSPTSNTCLQNLRKIDLLQCPKLRCLFSSSMVEHLHQLEWLLVSTCDEMEEVIEGDMLPLNSFPRLRYLMLAVLPNLGSICSQRLVFTCLEDIEVKLCPKLKKLPHFSSSIHEIDGFIIGGREWWEGLEWEDEHSKSLYSKIAPVNVRLDELFLIWALTSLFIVAGSTTSTNEVILFNRMLASLLECKPSPSGINSEECIRQLNRIRSNPECIRQPNWIESNVAATQQMRRALSAPFDNRVDGEAASSSALF